MKREVVIRAFFSAILSISLLTLGCSSDNSPTTKADAGKKDTGANGGSGGIERERRQQRFGWIERERRLEWFGWIERKRRLESFWVVPAHRVVLADPAAPGGSGGGGGTGGVAGSGGGTGTGGTGGTGGTSVGGTGGGQVDGGGIVDAESSDAQDSPLFGADGATSETGDSDDGGTTPLMDTGAQDIEGLDSEAIDTGAIFLDAEIDTAAVDSSGIDLPTNAENCIQQIVSNGYSFTGVQPCSDCQANSSDTASPGRCTSMIDCVQTNWPACSSGSCHLDCLHNVSGDGVVDACVIDLVHASCGPGF